MPANVYEMPFDVGESINATADVFLRAPIIMSVSRNPIYTAMLITFATVLIIMFVFRDVDADETLLVMCARSGFWIFLLMLGSLFLHDKVLTQEQVVSDNNAAYDSVFGGANILEDFVH